MRNCHNLKYFASLALVALAACVDATSSTLDQAADQPLAETFDELSLQSALDGDGARADELSYAALSVRRGVSPSRLEVRNGTVVEPYGAFVNAIEWHQGVNARPPAFRSLVAWRKTDSGVIRIIVVSASADSVPVRNPLSLGPGAGPVAVFAMANAMYRETTVARALSASIPETVWIGASGFAKMRELEVGRACEATPNQVQVKGVQCQTARYTVKFEITLQAATVRPFAVTSTASPRSLATVGEQGVNGAKFQFNCLRVSSLSGCP